MVRARLKFTVTHRGVPLGNRRRAKRSVMWVNLSEADLSEVDLFVANLWEANLRGSHLNGADL